MGRQPAKKNSSSKIFLGFKRFRDTYDFIDDALVGVEVKGKAGVANREKKEAIMRA